MCKMSTHYPLREFELKRSSLPFQFDVDNLKKLFSGLGFEVTVKQNLTKIMFDEELNNFSKNRLEIQLL